MMRSLAPAAVLLLAGCSSSPSTGTTAPDFKLKSVDGKEVSLGEMRGKGVLLAFWAVGCPPCRAEVPALERLDEKYRDRGLAILAVNAWDEPEATVKKFASDQGIKYTVLLYGGDLVRRYGVHAIPASFFIDAKGLITNVEEGYDPVHEGEMEERVKAILPPR